MTTRAEGISRILELDAKRTQGDFIVLKQGDPYIGVEGEYADGHNFMSVAKCKDHSLIPKHEAKNNADYFAYLANNAPRIIRDLVAENEALKQEAEDQFIRGMALVCANMVRLETCYPAEVLGGITVAMMQDAGCDDYDVEPIRAALIEEDRDKDAATSKNSPRKPLSRSNQPWFETDEKGNG